MTTDLKRLMGNIASLAVVRGLDFIVPIVTLPYLIGVLGLEMYGLIDYAMALALYFAAFINYGFGVTAVRGIALNREDLGEVSRLYSETVAAVCLLIFISLILYVPIVYLVDTFRPHAALYLYTFAFVSLQALFPTWLFRGLENISQGALLTAFSRLLYVVGIFLFVRSPQDYALVPALNAVTMLVAVIAAIGYANYKLKLRFKLPPFRRLLAVYKEGSDAFLAQLTPNLYNNSATFLLGAFSGTVAVGAFSAARKLVEAFSAAGMILSNAIFPYLLRNKDAVRRSHTLLWGVGVFLALACLLSADLAVLLLFPEVDAPIALYIRILGVGILGYFGSLIYHNNGLQLIKRDDIVRRISVLVSIIFFALGLVLVPVYGVYGAIGMVVGARLSMAISGWWGFKRATHELQSNQIVHD